MILEKFKIKFQGEMTNEIKKVLKNKVNNFDFSMVANMCVKFTAGMDFLLYELNDITDEISKNINRNLELNMFVCVDAAYTNDLKQVEVLTSNTIHEWERHQFLTFKEGTKCI